MTSEMPGRIVTLALVAGLTLLATARPGHAHLRFAQEWPDLSPAERYQTLRNFRRHERLPQERRRDIERRYDRWRHMSPDERERIRQNYQRFRQLPPRERERFERKYKKWRQEGEPPR